MLKESKEKLKRITNRLAYNLNVVVQSQFFSDRLGNTTVELTSTSWGTPKNLIMPLVIAGMSAL